MLLLRWQRLLLFAVVLCRCFEWSEPESQHSSREHLAMRSRNHSQDASRHHTNHEHEITSPFSDVWRNKSFRLQPWRPHKRFSLVFNKIEKCSSSTAGGVMRAIGYFRNATPDTHMTNMKTSKSVKSLLAEASADRVAQVVPEPFVMATHDAVHVWNALSSVSASTHFIRCCCLASLWLPNSTRVQY